MRLRILPLAAALSLAALLGGCAATSHSGSYYGYGASYGTSYHNSYGYPYLYPYGGYGPNYRSRERHRIHVAPAPTRDSGRYHRSHKRQHDRDDARPDRRYRSSGHVVREDRDDRRRPRAGAWRDDGRAAQRERTRPETSRRWSDRNRALRAEQQPATGARVARQERSSPGPGWGGRPRGPAATHRARANDAPGRHAGEGRASIRHILPRRPVEEPAD